jgi:heme/copper-type cytochrome/quinol oxidase subunit 3
MTSVTIGSPDLHIEDPNLIGRRWRTGVLLLILADMSFVAALVFSYFYLRGLNTEKAWLAHGQSTAAIWVSWAIAGGAVLSAVVYRLGLLGIRAGSERRFVSAALLALLLVAADAVAQMLQLGTFSFGVGTSAYSSAIYTLAGANLFHLLLTVFIGIAMWNRGRLHIYSQESNWQPQLVSLWWTWIAIASVLGAFATSFISSPNTGH